MTIIRKLEKLATEKNTPCVTISLNTHRTYPDNVQDIVRFKSYLKEAKERVINEFGKGSVSSLLGQLSEIKNGIDENYNLDSLHVYISNDTKEIIPSALPLNEPGVCISNTFNILSLMKSYNKSEEYYILLLARSGVHLYSTINDVVVNEIKNEDFPFSENRHFNARADKGNDLEYFDDSVRAFLNKVDKAVVKMNNETGLNCVVICTVDNYSRLMQVADKPSIYIGYSNIEYNNTAKHHIAEESWELVKGLQHNRRAKAIEEIKEAVVQDGVLTDLEEIFQASIDGRGDLLMVHQDYSQSVNMTNDRTTELTHDTAEKNAMDEIISEIAWAVLSNKGRVFFTTQDEIKEFGNIVLKTRL